MEDEEEGMLSELPAIAGFVMGEGGHKPRNVSSREALGRARLPAGEQGP